MSSLFLPALHLGILLTFLFIKLGPTVRQAVKDRANQFRSQWDQARALDVAVREKTAQLARLKAELSGLESKLKAEWFEYAKAQRAQIQAETQRQIKQIESDASLQLAAMQWRAGEDMKAMGVKLWIQLTEQKLRSELAQPQGAALHESFLGASARKVTEVAS